MDPFRCLSFSSSKLSPNLHSYLPFDHLATLTVESYPIHSDLVYPSRNHPAGSLFIFHLFNCIDCISTLRIILSLTLYNDLFVCHQYSFDQLFLCNPFNYSSLPSPPDIAIITLSLLPTIFLLHPCDYFSSSWIPPQPLHSPCNELCLCVQFWTF